MRRREFISLVGATAAAWPLAAQAQRSNRMRLLGVLIGFVESDPAGQSQLKAFQATLTKIGWTVGDNLQIEIRWGGGDADKVRTLAKELVDLRPDVILRQTTVVTEP